MDPLTIAAFDIFRYTLLLKSDIVIGSMRLNRRDGYLLRLSDESGTMGAGEIAPLAGFSAETLDDVREDIGRLRFSVYGNEVPMHLEELSGGFERWIGGLRLCPSVRFGFESAVLRLTANSRKIMVSRLISEAALDTVTSQGLLAGDVKEVLNKATDYYDKGWRTFKVKVGRGVVEREMELLALIRAQCPPGIVIRADANKAWNVDTALSFLATAKSLGVDYVEEPTQTWEELEECCAAWRRDIHAPIALDEHLGRFTAETIPNIPAISTFIVKPALAGVEASMRISRRAHLMGKQVVFSSPFESALGLSMTAALAAASHDSDAAHGFDANSWLINDLPGVSVGWDGPTINLGQFTDMEKRIRWDALEEVAID
jgi:o-succinylbenzoate synthase